MSFSKVALNMRRRILARLCPTFDQPGISPCSLRVHIDPSAQRHTNSKLAALASSTPHILPCTTRISRSTTSQRTTIKRRPSRHPRFVIRPNWDWKIQQRYVTPSIEGMDLPSDGLLMPPLKPRPTNSLPMPGSDRCAYLSRPMSLAQLLQEQTHRP